MAALKKLGQIVVLSLSTAFSSHTYSDSSRCYLDELPPKADPTLFDVYPLKFLTKSWMASAEMKAHFDAQKELFGQLSIPRKTRLSDQSGVTEASLASVGDLMRLPTNQRFVAPEVIQFLTNFDLLVGNLETLITETQPIPPDDLFLMNSHKALLESFNDEQGVNAFDALSLANNHVFDFDDRAITDTIANLSEFNIKASGFRSSPEDKPYTQLSHQGIQVGYYAISSLMNNLTALEQTELLFNPMLKEFDSTPFRLRTSDVCKLDYSAIKDALDQMISDGMDFKVLSIHWGFEHEMYPRPEQMQIARDLMALGFDVIFGSHAHTPQPAEICYLNDYRPEQEVNCRLQTADGKPRKSIVFYSLGNFNSYSNVFWQQVGTVASLNIQKTGDNTDWSSPAYRFTYDHTYQPPNSLQAMRFLDEEGIQCPWEKCGNNLKQQMNYPQRHLLGPSLTTQEQMLWGFHSATDTLSSFFIWTLGNQAAR